MASSRQGATVRSATSNAEHRKFIAGPSGGHRSATRIPDDDAVTHVTDMADSNDAHTTGATATGRGAVVSRVVQAWMTALGEHIGRHGWADATGTVLAPPRTPHDTVSEQNRQSLRPRRAA